VGLDLFLRGQPDKSHLDYGVELMPDSEGLWGLNDAANRYRAHRVAVCQRRGQDCVSVY